MNVDNFSGILNHLEKVCPPTLNFLLNEVQTDVVFFSGIVNFWTLSSELKNHQTYTCIKEENAGIALLFKTSTFQEQSIEISEAVIFKERGGLIEVSIKNGSK
jgi:hypothetical protein